jgi:hypothetical protein
MVPVDLFLTSSPLALLAVNIVIEQAGILRDLPPV